MSPKKVPVYARYQKQLSSISRRTHYSESKDNPEYDSESLRTRCVKYERSERKRTSHSDGPGRDADPISILQLRRQVHLGVLVFDTQVVPALQETMSGIEGLERNQTSASEDSTNSFERRLISYPVLQRQPFGGGLRCEHVSSSKDKER